MTRYAIGLGSNLGDRLAHLRFAFEGLGELGWVGAVSSLYESAPVGGPAQDPFLNAVVIVESDLDPLVLLDRLQEIENQTGRVRRTRWGPRTLDLDIVSSDGDLVSEEALDIPHPRAAEREFVLRPLAEVWPQARVAPDTPASEALRTVDNHGRSQDEQRDAAIDRVSRQRIGTGLDQHRIRARFRKSGETRPETPRGDKGESTSDDRHHRSDETGDVPGAFRQCPIGGHGDSNP